MGRGIQKVEVKVPFLYKTVNIVNMIIVCFYLLDLVFVLLCHLIPYVSSMIILTGTIGNCFGGTWNEMTTNVYTFHSVQEMLI